MRLYCGGEAADKAKIVPGGLFWRKLEVLDSRVEIIGREFG
jgi:hypothetical protein